MDNMFQTTNQTLILNDTHVFSQEVIYLGATFSAAYLSQTWPPLIATGCIVIHSKYHVVNPSKWIGTGNVQRGQIPYLVGTLAVPGVPCLSDCNAVAMIHEHPWTKPGHRCTPEETSNLQISQLVGGWATPLKNMKVNWDDEIPNIWKNNKCSKAPTSKYHNFREKKRTTNSSAKSSAPDFCCPFWTCLNP